MTGTPVQNNVTDVWATFDFLMPNFLGSSRVFAKEFAKPIAKSYSPGASAKDIAEGLEKLRALHQQVLPFILRREKEHVLQELPPKSISVIPCELSRIQKQLYDYLTAGESAKHSLDLLQRTLDNCQVSESNVELLLGRDTLKALLFLRLLCTHPILVNAKQGGKRSDELCSIESSGKLRALHDLLRSAGIHGNDLLGADNDDSLLYCGTNVQGDTDSDSEEFNMALDAAYDIGSSEFSHQPTPGTCTKCLIFAQFTHSLDVVEEFLLKPHMPSIRYLRLDGRVPEGKRADVVDMFNRDESVRILLLTTRIGGLGLNLTGKVAVKSTSISC